MLELVPQNDQEQIERSDEPWKYPYIAATIDFGSNFQIKVLVESESRVGYVISPQLYINSTNPAVMGFLEEFSENHGLNPRFREREDTIRMEITKRTDVRDLLRLVAPYVIVRRNAVAILLDDLLPGLDAGKQSDEEGFVELMEYVDEIRSHTTQRSEPKYTEDYFRDEFGL